MTRAKAGIDHDNVLVEHSCGGTVVLRPGKSGKCGRCQADVALDADGHVVPKREKRGDHEHLNY